MDEQLKTKLIQYLDKLEGAAHQVGEVTATEIPATIREYLAWLLIEHTVYAVLGIVPAVILAIVTKRVVRWINTFDELNPIQFFGPMLLFMAWVGAACALATTVYHSMQTVKVAVSPRVVLIEKVGRLIKSNEG